MKFVFEFVSGVQNGFSKRTFQKSLAGKHL